MRDTRTNTKNAMLFGKNKERKTVGKNYTKCHIASMIGKMSDVVTADGEKKVVRSLSSSIDNDRCREKIANARTNGDTDCICYYCFSDLAQYHNPMEVTANGMRKNGENNQRILTSGFLNNDDIPTLDKVDLFRFESHADVSSIIQLINYLKFCEVNLERGNHRTQFTIWTKNGDIFRTVFNIMGVHKPDNLTICYSSPYVNRTMEIDRDDDWFVDIIFTVWKDGKTCTNETGRKLNCCDEDTHKTRRCATCDNSCYGCHPNEIEYRDELLRKPNDAIMIELESERR